MKTFLILLSLAFSIRANCQGFGFRDLAFMGQASTPASSGSDPVFNSLTHYYSLDESSGTRADSKGVVNLTPNSTGGSAAGIDGNALNSVGNTDYLGGTGLSAWSPPFSISLWFKIGVADSGQLFATSLADEDILLTIDNGPQITFTDQAVSFAGTASYTANSWNLVVVTGTGAGGGNVNYKWSVNGAALSADLTDVISTATVITIGPRQGTHNLLIDEVGIYNTALSSADCATIWNSGSGKFYRP